jgi:hypothetical protein
VPPPKLLREDYHHLQASLSQLARSCAL